ncbi:MAG: protease modulator HflC [Alphaproteobacteria bacterium]|jgi:membrane protease subunit HflC|nr:protease modulator HflC [Alphaproteobacteria bacterium]
MKKISRLLAGILVLFIFSAFKVNETQQALVLRFGNVKRVITSAGLHFRAPFIDNVKYIEKRVLNLDPPAEEVILGDTKRLVVDVFARYQIVDPLKYYQVLKTENQAVGRLNKFVNSQMRSVLGKVSLDEVLSENRASMMDKIKQGTNTEVSRMGIKVVDVRIGRADLPKQNSEAVYSRMRSEREREAAEARAQGKEIAIKTKASADKERDIILSEAKKEAEEMKGQGDQEAIDIYADAYSKDKEFYKFYRSMNAYQNSLTNDTTVILNPSEAGFLKEF